MQTLNITEKALEAIQTLDGPKEIARHLDDAIRLFSVHEIDFEGQSLELERTFRTSLWVLFELRDFFEEIHVLDVDPSHSLN